MVLPDKTNVNRQSKLSLHCCCIFMQLTRAAVLQLSALFSFGVELSLHMGGNVCAEIARGASYGDAALPCGTGGVNRVPI